MNNVIILDSHKHMHPIANSRIVFMNVLIILTKIVTYYSQKLCRYIRLKLIKPTYSDAIQVVSYQLILSN